MLTTRKYFALIGAILKLRRTTCRYLDDDGMVVCAMGGLVVGRLDMAPIPRLRGGSFGFLGTSHDGPGNHSCGCSMAGPGEEG